MIHLAYPNILQPDEFIGCGRYHSLPLDHSPEAPVPGYRRAESHTGDIDHLLRAIEHFAPDYGMQHPPVYQQENGRDSEYGGRSLELAYLLAAIHCVRRLRLETTGLVGDLWCTGRIVQRDTTFFLETVEPETFGAKLNAFLAVLQDPYKPGSPTEDTLFFVPARNFARTPEYEVRCQDAAAVVCSVQEFVHRLSSSADWSQHKTVVKVRDRELTELIDLLFDGPHQETPRTLSLSAGEIDKLIAAWKQKLDTAQENVLELEALVGYQWLKGDARTPGAQLTGVSATEVTPALAALDDLWTSFPLLFDMVTRAEQLRKKLPAAIFTSDKQLREIYDLLTVSSIKLPPVRVPLEQRGLLTPAEITSSVTPERLLEAMNNAFAVARKAVVAIEEVLTRVMPALTQIQDRITDLKAAAQALGEDSLPELDEVAGKAAVLLALTNTDPLAVKHDVDAELAPALQKVQARIGLLTRQRDQVQAALGAARTQLRQLEELSYQCDAAWQKCLADITDPIVQTRKPELLKRLGQWLPTLEVNVSKGQWRAVNIALQNWQKMADEFRQVEQAAVDAFTAMTDKRMELRGRLATYKVRAVRMGVAEDPTLMQLAHDAEFHLYHPQKTPLGEAQLLVDAYRGRIDELST